MPHIIADNIWLVAAVWMLMALFASIVSIRLGVSVALIEIFVGIIAGNFLGIHPNADWINFLAMLGSGVITFLAGAEIDPVSLRQHIKPAMVIGVFRFCCPFCWFCCLPVSSSDGLTSRPKLPALHFPQLQWQWSTR